MYLAGRNSEHLPHFFLCDEKELALEEMKRYWGEMIHEGADTFRELYNPYNR